MTATIWSIGSGVYDLSQTFLLNSRPAANQTIYLDFDGHTTGNVTGSSWDNLTSPAWDLSGNGASFTTTEQQTIQKIWTRVAEDFAPFNVNVTTQDPGVESLRKSGTSDTRWGIRVVITPDDTPSPGAGGVAYVGSFNSSNGTPAYVFNSSEKNAAEAISHEVGHSLGLDHDGTSSVEYYSGHGSGALSWGPIMGASYSPIVTQWSRGEYTGANNTQDDLAIITSQNGFTYRTDDYGSTQATATSLLTQGTSQVAARYGVIERNTDSDWFSFWASAGTTALSVNASPLGPNLAVRADVYNASGTLLFTINSTSSLNAGINVALPSAGEYFLKVSGAGRGNVATTGFSNYGSLGHYRIQGTVPAYVAPNTAPVAVNDAATTTVGVPVTVNVLANDTDANADTLSITSVSNVVNGVASISGTNVLFTPTTGFTGAGSFTYTISDGRGGTASASGSIAINPPPNTSPVAVNDTASTTVGAALVVAVLANDSDANGDSLSIASISGQVNGTASIAGTNVVFTPTAGFIGTGSFNYSISDGRGGTASATATITINPAPNSPPVALNDQTSTLVGVPVSVYVLANDNDPNGDTLSIASVANAQNGVAVISGAVVIFTPTAGFTGTASFDYTASDGRGGTATALATIAVNLPPNTPPVAVNDSETTVTGLPVSVLVLGNDTDANGHPLNITGVSDAVNGSVVVAGSAIIFTPDAGFVGTGSFTYSISDGHGGSSSAVVSITVNPFVANHSLTNNTDIAISPLASSTVASTISVAGVFGTLRDVNVRLNIQHTRVADLVVTLIAPSGTRVPLFQNRDAQGANLLGTTFDDSAKKSISDAAAPFTGVFRPVKQLAILVGEIPNGEWRLEVSDKVAGNGGFVDNWSLDFVTALSAVPSPAPVPAAPAPIARPVDLVAALFANFDVEDFRRTRLDAIRMTEKSLPQHRLQTHEPIVAADVEPAVRQNGGGPTRAR